MDCYWKTQLKSRDQWSWAKLKHLKCSTFEGTLESEYVAVNNPCQINIINYEIQLIHYTRFAESIQKWDSDWNSSIICFLWNLIKKEWFLVWLGTVYIILFLIFNQVYDPLSFPACLQWYPQVLNPSAQKFYRYGEVYDRIRSQYSEYNSSC